MLGTVGALSQEKIMSLTLEQKQSIVAEVNAIATHAQAAIAAEYIGLSVAQMTNLRVKARNAGVYVKVVKNTLARRAVVGTAFECLMEKLTGPLVLVFSADDPGACARLVRDFLKENQKLKPIALAFGGQLRGPEDLQALATLPTLDEARAMLLGVFEAPATQLVRTLAEPSASFVRVLAAYRDQQQAA
jgi:large subunit ribosomal protein L10